MALAGFEVWHWLWAPFQILAILYSIRWSIRAGVRLNVACLVAALFCDWLGHAQAGQFTVFILCAALWAVPPESDQEIQPGVAASLAILMSSKVFNVFSLLGVFRSFLRPRTIAITLISLVALNGLVIGILRLHGNSISIVELYRQWMTADVWWRNVHRRDHPRSGQSQLHGGRLETVSSRARETPSKDIWVAFSLGILLSALWFRFSHALARAERWSGWIAVGGRDRSPPLASLLRPRVALRPGARSGNGIGKERPDFFGGGVHRLDRDSDP